ncbi:MAG: hypothetical protein ACJ79O_17955 [Myxococcales bacterium]
MFRSASFSVFVLATACATTTGTNRPQLGTVHLRPYTAPGASPAVFSVQQGRILSPDLDVVADPDGCLRGHAGNSPVELCPAKGTPPPEKPGDKVEQWTGPTGNFTLEMMDGGSRLRMDGFVRGLGRGVGREIPMNATVPLGKGPHWDELRKHPAFLALAATISGIRGEPTDSAIQDALED